MGPGYGGGGRVIEGGKSGSYCSQVGRSSEGFNIKQEEDTALNDSAYETFHDELESSEVHTGARESRPRMLMRTRSLDRLSEVYSRTSSSNSQDNISCRSESVSTSEWHQHHHRGAVRVNPEAVGVRSKSCSGTYDADISRTLLRADKRHSSADDLNSIMAARDRLGECNTTPSYVRTAQAIKPMSSNTSGSTADLKCYTCPHCHYGATKKGQVRKHMSVHGIFLCAHCEFMCDQPELLDDHRRRQHPGLCGRRLCKKCRVLFPSTELDSHEQQCSGEKQRWVCPECGKHFKFLSVMKAHVLKWHPPDDALPSTTTLATTATMSSSLDTEETENESLLSSSRDETMTPVTDPPPTPTITTTTTTTIPSPCKPVAAAVPAVVYQCEECGKSFKTKWTLSNHSIQAHGAVTPFCCDVDGCNGTPFRSDKELNSHRETVHQLGPRKYHCGHPGCSMQFAKYGHFKRHQSTHTGQCVVLNF